MDTLGVLRRPVTGGTTGPFRAHLYRRLAMNNRRTYGLRNGCKRPVTPVFRFSLACETMTPSRTAQENR